MFTDRAEGLMRFSRVIKYASAAASCLLTAGMTAADGSVSPALQAALVPASMMFLVLLAGGPSWYSWSRTYFQSPIRTALMVTVQDTLLAGLSLLAVRSITPSATAVTIPPGPCVLTAAVTLLLLNRFLPSAISGLMFPTNKRPRILVLGPVGATQMIRRQLEMAQAVGLNIVDGHAMLNNHAALRLFTPDTSSKAEENVSRVAPIHSRIHQPDSPHAVDRVIFVRQNDGEPALKLQREIQCRCNAAGLPLTIYTEEQSALHQPVIPISAATPDISPVPQEPLQNPVNLAIKRAMDILISIPVVLIVLPPLCLLIRLIHRRQSPGPLFYRQERCGRNGSTFQIFKFRTMHLPKPGQTDLEANPAPRIFELGAVLRDSRLDEIPQFINVLLGTMSIVGPRAHHVQDRVRFSSKVPHYPMRMQAKPGITGQAQYKEYRGVFHRNSVESRVACDLNYISQWSVQTDIVLMLKTGRVIGESLFRAGLQKLSEHSAEAGTVALGHPVLNTMADVQAPQNSQAA